MTEKQQAMLITFVNLLIVVVLVYFAFHPRKVQAASSQRFWIEHVQVEPSTELQVIHDALGACHGVWVHYVGGALVVAVPLGSVVC